MESVETAIISEEFPEEKTFKYCDECSINISTTPSGFSTIVMYIRGTPFFGVGSVYSLTAVELPDCKLYYNDKAELLLDEDITEGEDRDRRILKLSFYKDNEANQYRFDFVPLTKTGIPELDAQDPWKDFSDILQAQPGAMQMDMVKRFTDLLGISRNDPTLISMCDIPKNQLPLEDGVGIFMFRRVQ